MDNIALIVHGGAGQIPGKLAQTCRHGIERALERGWNVLQSGGMALDACEQAILELEEEPVFDAGVGSHLNKDGKVQLDAILMDGVTLKSGAAVAVERIRNPIRLARLILEKSEHMLLSGYGAEQFAFEHGLGFCDPTELITESERTIWSTRSARLQILEQLGRSLGMPGNLASGTSTGGTLYKYPGRIGDSALIGCGCYADNWSGAASCTGHGESIMKVILAKTATDFVVGGKAAQAAAEEAITLLGKRTTGRAGLIILDRQGRPGVAFSTPHMAFAYRTPTASEIFDSES